MKIDICGYGTAGPLKIEYEFVRIKATIERRNL